MQALRKPAIPEMDLEDMAAILAASGRYKVLRKLEPRRHIHKPDGTPQRLALFVDVETTGLDPEKDEIIEIALVPFTYAPDGRIFEILPAYQSLQQPSRPITPQITAITGITDAMVEGQKIDLARVRELVERAALIVAHNAAFDRKFLERLSDSFVLKPWACSMSQVDWAAEGHEGVKLAYLAAGAGFFYDRHRAENDCLAAIELLATPLPNSGTSAMAQMLANARQPSWRIWAERAPFDLKDVLKARGYRWNAEASAGPKAWYTDVPQSALEAELAWLQSDIYAGEVEPLMKKLDAYNRFSARI